MAYLQSVHGQLLLCLRGVGFGFSIGIGYELFRFLRMLFGARAQAVWDAVFGAFAGLGVFLFALVYDDGRLRAYALLALVCGFAVCYRLCAAALRRRSERALCRLRRFGACAVRPFRTIGIKAEHLRRVYGSKLEKNLKRMQKK